MSIEPNADETNSFAVFIKPVPGFTGDARLFKLIPPLEEYDCNVGVTGPFEYVVVSATRMAGIPETYIFPSDEDGDVVDWGQLQGSYHGGLSHVEALRRAGYVAVEVAS